MTQRSDLIDIVITSRNGAPAVKKILKEAADAPANWVRHQFIVVFNNTDHDAITELGNWYRTFRKELPLPNVIARQTPDSVRDIQSLRHYAVGLGHNPYIYFQEDDAPLPEGLDLRIDMMQTYPWDAIYGLTQVVHHGNTIAEQFPTTNTTGAFRYNPEECALLFPTYFHPWGALFRRTLFDKIPIETDEKYTAASAAFLTRLLFSEARMSFIPDVVKKACRRDSELRNITLSPEECNALARDIQTWQPYVNIDEVKDFQMDIAEKLKNGDIVTLKEIESLVEDYLDQSNKG